MKGVQIDPLFPEKATFKNPIRVNDLFIIRNHDWGLLLKNVPREGH